MDHSWRRVREKCYLFSCLIVQCAGLREFAEAQCQFSRLDTKVASVLLETELRERVSHLVKGSPWQITKGT